MDIRHANPSPRNRPPWRAVGGATRSAGLRVFASVRSAGKPAGCLWRPAVAAEPKAVGLLLDADARLAGGAGGVVRCMGGVAGLENGAVARLQSGVVAACSEAFE